VSEVPLANWRVNYYNLFQKGVMMYKKRIILPVLGILSVAYAQNMNMKKTMPSGDKIAPNIGLDKTIREESGKLLNTLLADEFVLYTKTYNYHWNVVGIMFNDLHSFFRIQYEALEGIVDATAERVRAVGIRAIGTLSEFLQNTRLKEDAPGVVPAAKEMIKNLLEDHETIIRNIRDDLVVAEESNDMGTNNYLNDLLCKHEKMAWMLRSYVQ